MKKTIILMFYIVAATNICMFADRQPIVIHNGGAVGDHYNFPVPVVEPEVYYDDDNQEIIIVGTGNASYYNVVIESVTDWNVSISTQVNGYYDTIDISSLPADEYSISITTQWNDTFVGYFEIE